MSRKVRDGMPTRRIQRLASTILLMLLWASTSTEATPEEQAVVAITVREEDVEEPVPARIHLMSLPGIAQKAPGYPFFKDHFVFPGKVEIALEEGTYTYEVERGPERTRA